MSKTAAKPHLSEAEEQCKLMAWAEYCVWAGVYPELALLFAIPNGGKRNAADLLKHKYGISQTARTYINTADTIIEAEVSEE